MLIPILNVQLHSPGFWRCRQPLIMFLKSDEICSNLLERDKDKMFHYWVYMRVCVINHNRYLQMTGRCPQRVCHYLIATVRSVRLIGHRAASQETDIEKKDPQGQQPITLTDTLMSPSTGEEKLSPKHTHTLAVQSHTLAERVR